MQPNVKFEPTDPAEEIVISGFAGRFPESKNVDELRTNLMNKMDLITQDDRRWELDHIEVPQRTGKVHDLEKFDSLFFGVHFKQAHTMDPMCRMLLEHAYEAIIDAGVNPKHLRGTKTGVIVGACFSESEKTWFYEKLQASGFGITGCSRAMLANRISYWLGVHGPSYTVDSACSSSLFAIDQAYKLIKSGQCDAVLVGGSNLCLHPYVSLQFARLGVLSHDGRCKSFDADANGYVRSETVSAIFIQKAKNAKRIYATLVHTKTNCDGYKPQGITYPSSEIQLKLLNDFYNECGIPPTVLSFLEAHGTGTKVGDPEELNAIDKIFCKGRTTPLKIGSVKSNLGHSEPASGLCSVAKVIIGMESGLIPPNINLNKLRKGISVLDEGRVEVVTEPTPWDGGYVGINSFGFGGANAHILLKSYPKKKVNNGAPNDDLPRLIIASGRTEEAVSTLLSSADRTPIDVEYIRLLHEIHSDNVTGHLYRGYTIVGQKGVDTLQKEILNYPGTKRPLWFVFSGMGSQWAGMGEALMRFPIFAKAIQKCDAVLKPRGIDIVNIITNKDKKTFDNILNSFVGIAAIQIGLVDLLTAIGIVPDNIIGHSVGELGCAYADGCFTAEQMILAAYSRGLASIETKMIRGSMAAIGLGYDEIKDMCPADIEVACHNGPDSCTISGPEQSIKDFVTKLQNNKIFAKEVACSNIAYHSRYIAEAGSKLLAYLREVIPEPKPRSEKWVSTSVPKDSWSLPEAKYSSAEYHTNNLLRVVLFEETARLIPKDAITVEIAPHGLLQAILRRSLHTNVTNVALTQRGYKDNAEFFLRSLGKLYNVGVQFNIANLYPPVEFPVSRGTPAISPHVRWEHSQDWYVTSYKQQEKTTSGERVLDVGLSDENYEYMAGHIIDGRNLLPATGYLLLVWETVSKMTGLLYSEISVVFEDVKFERATNIPKKGDVRLTVMVQKGSGRFEIVESDAAVVTGMVRVTTKPSQEMIPLECLPVLNDEEFLTTKDIYKELKLRGYDYASSFRGLKSASLTGNKGHIAWTNNWAIFMDNMLQIHQLRLDSRALHVPTAIEKLVIDTKLHQKLIREMQSDNKVFPVYVYKEFNTVKSGGIEIRGVQANEIFRRRLTSAPVLEEYNFVAYRDKAEISLENMVVLTSNLACENHAVGNIKILELVEDQDNVAREELLSPMFAKAFNDLPLIHPTAILAVNSDRYNDTLQDLKITIIDQKKLPIDNNMSIVSGYNLLSQRKSVTLKQLFFALKDQGYILTREDTINIETLSCLEKYKLDVLMEKRFGKQTLLLLKKNDVYPKKLKVVHLNTDKFESLEKLQQILKEEDEKNNNEETRIIVVEEGNPDSGLLGFANCLRREPNRKNVRIVMIQDKNAPKFSLDNPVYAKQLQLDLAVNILQPGNIWGSYKHLPLRPPQPIPVYHAYIVQLVRGDLSSFRCVQGPIQPDNKQNLVYITHAALNFRDVMIATGKLSSDAIAQKNIYPDHSVGFEYSGIDTTGRRIMGIIESRGLANMCIPDEYLHWEIPKEFTLEDAATIPCTYGTAYYALCVVGKVKKGDKVLIHVGSGGVGQAAINIALQEECEVFTTVGTPEKRRFIKEMFPSIDDNHIGTSRNTSFEQLILKQTNGKGVDIVLNSLAEEKLQASIRCLAPKGRFLEIGKFDFASNNKLGLRPFLNEISFHAIMVDSFFIGNREEKKKLHNFISKGLEKKMIKPLTRKCFEKNEVETAFRYMASAKHIGKVIIKMQDEKNLTAPIHAYPQYHCVSNKSYVIIGGLGGFGLELADWLFMRRARNLILVSRNGIKNGYQRYRVEKWRSRGAKVIIISGKDASKHEDCEFILKSAEKEGPVDGIFNLAVQLRDKLYINQTVEDFEESIKPKAGITKKLDELSRKLCPNLRHFVVFSSVSCGRGTPGQTNYGLGNSLMERICEKRMKDGYPALAIQWGSVGDVGILADMQEDNKELVIGGTSPQRITSCLQELGKFLVQDKPIVSSMVVAEKRTSGTGASNIMEAILNIMGLNDLKGISQQTSLAELGMDSMMAVEIKQALERDFEIFLTAQDIRNLNFAKITEMSTKVAKEQSAEKANINTTIDELSGMKMLIRTLGTAIAGPEVCVELPVKNIMYQDEVFFIPGIEGNSHVLQSILPHLRHPATCLQIGINEMDDIEQLAEFLLPHLLERTKHRRDFVLVGYSFGALIALEIARKLEAKHFFIRLILVDGSPKLMRTMKRELVPATTQDEFENNLIVGFMNHLHPALATELINHLNGLHTWQERVDVLFSHVPPESLKIPASYAKAMCTVIYKRLIALENYKPSKLAPLQTPITLVKPTTPSVRGMESDYGLGKLTRGKVDVYELEGSHITILENDKLADIFSGESIEDAEAYKIELLKETVNPESSKHYGIS